MSMNFSSALATEFNDSELRGATQTDQDVIAEGDKVLARITNRGTFEGEFMGAEPNGNTFETSAIEIVRFEDGQISEMWLQIDALGMMWQLRIAPEGPPT